MVVSLLFVLSVTTLPICIAQTVERTVFARSGPSCTVGFALHSVQLRCWQVSWVDWIEVLFSEPTGPLFWICSVPYRIGRRSDSRPHRRSD